MIEGVIKAYLMKDGKLLFIKKNLNYVDREKLKKFNLIFTVIKYIKKEKII